MGKVSLQLIQVICAITWCLFAAGPIFGFAALKPILIQEGVYSGLCTPVDGTALLANASNLVPLKEGSLKPCTAQDLKLNFMFTLGAGTTNVVALLVGYVLDVYGPSVCVFAGSGFLTMGALSLALSSKISFFDPYITGYVLLAVGGPFVFISTFQLANGFPNKSGTILALLTGAFDSSSALFFIYRLIYQNWMPSLTLKKFFTGYLIVPLFIFVCQLFIMPKESYKSLGAVQKLEIEGLDMNGNLPEGEDGSRIIPDETERQSLLSSHSNVHPVLSNDSRRKSVWENYVEAKLEKKTKGIFGVMHGYSASEQIKSPWFVLMLAFVIICMLRINYFVATVRSQEEFLLGSHKLALKVNSIFDVALPVGGLVSIPFIGLVLDHCSTLTAIILVSSISLVIGILGLIPSFSLNLLGIFMLVAYRPFYYTVVSDYCAKVFGFDTFGTVYGLLMCLSGIFNLGQSVLDRSTHTTFNMNPTPINSILVAVTAVTSTTLIVYVYKESKAREERMQVFEQMETTTKTTPEAPAEESAQYGTLNAS
ncbi:LANO_0H17216g1_1 [Lachancea nothofagi CBS 11611]|uniref:LANO_0H17216g1_1 n=1 Tax=Lachancea nothofagi CBS 11611 TaxID=1266666 RepID=A0A1G4KN48_9SACH|nr:LANO_0H17216g1_1 [Lachancea nothofagi CBS 11611]